MSAPRAAFGALRAFRTSCKSLAESSSGKGGITHTQIVKGDGHHGLRPGYDYDWEHGAHYIRADKIPNFHKKWSIVMPVVFTVAFGIPAFAVWWQQSKLKA